jgi:hypothetical protein
MSLLHFPSQRQHWFFPDPLHVIFLVPPQLPFVETVWVGLGVAVEVRVAPTVEVAERVVVVMVDERTAEIEEVEGLGVVDRAAGLELELTTDEELDTTDEAREETTVDDGATVEDWLTAAEEATEGEALTDVPHVPNSGLQPVPQ